MRKKSRRWILAVSLVALAGSTQADVPDEGSRAGQDCAAIEAFARAKVRKVKVGGSTAGGDAVISGDYDGGRFFFFCNEAHDRMRITAPVANGAEMDAAELRRLLQANFTGALDARYALSDGVVWSLFVHSLSGLTDAELESGLAQVATLKRTHGSTLTSTELAFGRDGG